MIGSADSQQHLGLVCFEKLFKAFPIAMFVFHRESFRFLEVNEAALSHYGYTREEFLAMDLFSLVHQEDCARLRESLSVVGPGFQKRGVWRNLKRDGSVVEMDISRNQLDFGGQQAVIVAATDVSEERRALAEAEAAKCQAQEALLARDDLLSIASHDLKTPLTAMLAQVQLLQRRMASTGEIPAERCKQMLANVEHQAKRMVTLVNRLLDVTRIRAGKLILEPAPMDLAEVAREVLERLASEFDAAKCKISFESVGSAIGNWDRFRLEQVLVNLLTNVVKYAPGAPAMVRISGSDSAVVLEVEDHGCGIPPEYLDRVFERFERVLPAQHRKGLGLGLYIVRQIVDAHGGSIFLESQLERGATFRIELPRAMA